MAQQWRVQEPAVMSLTRSGFAAHVISARHSPGAGCRWRPFHPSGDACERLLTSVANTVVVGVPCGSQTCHFLSVAVASESSECLFLPQCSLWMLLLEILALIERWSSLLATMEPEIWTNQWIVTVKFPRVTFFSGRNRALLVVRLRAATYKWGSLTTVTRFVLQVSILLWHVHKPLNYIWKPIWRSKNIFSIFKHTHILSR